MGANDAKLYTNDVTPPLLTAKNTTVALLVIFAVSCFLKYRRGLKIIRNYPGLRVPFYPTGPPGVILPTTWWNPGYLFLWQKRLTNYTQFGVDTFSVVPFVVGEPCLYTANLDVLRQTVGGGHKTSFAKAEDQGDILQVWGMNLLAADKEVWRKHRRIVAPAFNPKLYQDVWAKTIQIYKEALVVEKWAGEKEVLVPRIQAFTFKLALLIIGRCGFGFDFTWGDPAKTVDGRKSVQQALEAVVESHLLLGFAPKWLLRLPLKRFREAHDAREQLDEFMMAQVAQRKAQVSQKGVETIGNDIFTMLVKANEDEGTKYRLDDSELIGNVFVMMFAGHETTAHAMAATLGLLCVHQDIQAEIYEEILAVCGRDGEPSLEDYDKFTKVQAAFYEAIRLFPAAHLLIRQAWEDTIVHIPKSEGEDGATSIPVPKGTYVIVDMVGVQYNPRYFPDPTAFKPSRWYGVSNDSDTFSAFSLGPRACVGRKFALSEGLAFLTSLLRDFSVHPLLNPGETVEEWKIRVLDAKIRITLGVNDIPLRLVRRT